MKKILKALCLVLLVYSACFGDCGTLERRSNLKKRMQAQNTPKAIAQELEQLTRQADKDLTGNNKQFGYIYLQPSLIFDDSAVGQALLKNRTLPLEAYAGTAWPLSADNTNFRMAHPDYKEPAESNYGHSEYQLIANNNFDKMLENFITRHSSCPKFVILYSTLIPCMYPPNKNKYPGTRCVGLTGKASNTLKSKCPQAFFYLYTRQTSLKQYNEELLQKILDSLKKNNVIWITP